VCNCRCSICGVATVEQYSLRWTSRVLWERLTDVGVDHTPRRGSAPAWAPVSAQLSVTAIITISGRLTEEGTHGDYTYKRLTGSITHWRTECDVSRSGVISFVQQWTLATHDRLHIKYRSVEELCVLLSRGRPFSWMDPCLRYFHVHLC